MSARDVFHESVKSALMKDKLGDYSRSAEAKV